MDIQKFLSEGKSHFLSNLSIDHVIIGYEHKKLKCLLLEVGEKWLLPGGFVKRNEAVDYAVARILKDRTRLENAHTQFLSVFGEEGRQFSAQWKQLLERFGLLWKEDYWINARFVTLAYYSLVNIREVHPQPGFEYGSVSWFDFDDLPDMWMDHKQIVMRARLRLKEDISVHQVSYNLLPDRFTMPELHQLHQTILGEKIDRSRFQKKMLATGIFERLPKLQKEAPGRNPFQYRVRI
mgnify:CR=1 FL=1